MTTMTDIDKVVGGWRIFLLVPSQLLNIDVFVVVVVVVVVIIEDQVDNNY
jgi:hypothetical protein